MQYVRCRYARRCHPAGVEEHVTRKRNAPEAGRSRVRPLAMLRPGPHREGEEPKPMMHGHGKSDPNVVAEKPANNAEQSAAESVEPRTGTKGKAGQQSTRRAQDRESVSQALERIRIAARQRRKERFTSLFHHVNPAMLRMAFYAIKRDAAPGVDGMMWETYEQELDHRIEDLHTRV